MTIVCNLPTSSASSKKDAYFEIGYEGYFQIRILIHFNNYGHDNGVF